jgi:hypothetical protein
MLIVLSHFANKSGLSDGGRLRNSLLGKETGTQGNNYAELNSLG